MFRKIYKNSYVPFLAAKWTGVYKNLPKVNKNKFTSFQLFFLAAKWSGYMKIFHFEQATFLMAAKHGHLYSNKKS